MAIAGVVSSSGWSVAPDLARSLNAMATAPRTTRIARLGAVSLGTCDQGIRAEYTAHGAINHALFDGRLDNRKELQSALCPSRPAASEAELALRAYERRDDDFLDAFLGDFACAIWDSARRRLVLGRDALGIRALHFWRGEQTVFFASEPRGLLAQQQIPRSVNETWVARWLALLPQDDTSTAYAGIERIPPGHVVSLHTNRIRLHRYWRPEELPAQLLPSDAEYEGALRDKLNEAVACRIATPQNVGICLSGGLDSSSVAVLAAAQLSRRGKRLTAFTAVPADDFDSSPYPTSVCNEAALASSVVAAHSNMEHILVHNDVDPLFDALDIGSAALDEPVRNTYNRIWVNAIFRAAGQRGIGVLLAGNMGNLTISYDGSFWLTQLLREGRWLRLARELAALSRNGYPLLPLAGRAVAPLLPAGLRRALRRAIHRPEPELYDFSAINPAFAKRLAMEEEALEIAGNMGNTPAGRRGDPRLPALLRYDRSAAINSARRIGGVELLDPTDDRRVVEFCLSIPQEQFLRDGEPRSLIRRTMRDLLPSPLLRERRRGLQSADWHRVAAAARQEMIKEIARLERNEFARDCLDLPRLRRLLDNWPSTGWHLPAIRRQYARVLGRGLSLGRFVRRLEGDNS
jgi:asparagine synthase (glutamine-hydrolysing)